MREQQNVSYNLKQRIIVLEKAIKDHAKDHHDEPLENEWLLWQTVGIYDEIDLDNLKN